jgi:S1-C subfamily serine protease
MEDVYDGTVIAREHGTDLALLRVFNAKPHPWAPIAANNPPIGTHVHVVGHPAAFNWTYLEGVVSQERSSIGGEDRPYTQIQVPMTHGSSGGGAFNDAGELVGLADCMTESLPAEGFFNTVEEIRHIIRITGVRLP